MQAYIALHPQLKTTHFGQYVAIYGGQLVDHDADHAALYERIDARYPNEYVWMSKVEAEPMQTLHWRSPNATITPDERQRLAKLGELMRELFKGATWSEFAEGRR